ncbi:MAG: hypothetical protein PHR35_08915 [Kiritimatiellae bacterium]|nr:hypothetical protein [Kiritimatiellia bacterium]
MPDRVRPGNGAGLLLSVRALAGLEPPCQVQQANIGRWMRRTWCFVEIPGPSFREDGLRDFPYRHPDPTVGDNGNHLLTYQDRHDIDGSGAARVFHEWLTRYLQSIAGILHDKRRDKRDIFWEMPLAEALAQFAVSTDAGPAPRALIWELSRDLPPHLHELAFRPRRMLRRFHRDVAMDRMQEMDVTALVDYARRPGRTAALKAGEKQRLLAVVRQETTDTMENRVVRDLCSRAFPQARAYVDAACRKCDSGIPGTLAKCHASPECRGNTVNSFQRLCDKLLHEPPFASVTPLRTPCRTPNYALQQNVRYIQVWRDYQRLLRQEDVLDQTWRWQRRTWADLVRLWIAHSVEQLDAITYRATYRPFRVRMDPEMGAWLKPQSLPGPFLVSAPGGHDVTIHLLNPAEVDAVLHTAWPLSALNADLYLAAAPSDVAGVRVLPVWAMIGDARWLTQSESLRQEWGRTLASAVATWHDEAGRRRTTVGPVRIVTPLIVRAAWDQLPGASQTAMTSLEGGTRLLETQGSPGEADAIVNAFQGLLGDLLA